MRDNGTYQSNVFSPVKAVHVERPASRARPDEGKWKSSVFDEPLSSVQEKPRKTTIRQNDAGTSGLFGNEKVEFASKNVTLANMSRSTKKWTPVLRESKTADQRKREELYGKTSTVVPPGKRGDSALMSSASDWRNPQSKAS
jgi:hypothetical protein